MWDVIGYSAGVLTTVAFVPQLWKVWRSRSARDVSLATFLVFTAGLLLWLAYGIGIRSVPVILANTVTLVLALSIVGLKLRYDRRPHR
jgi:MtN3 and saliva related transmembrane protein